MTLIKIPIVVPIADKTDSAGNVILDGNVPLGNITCISKARLGNYITDLTKKEMIEVDKAISLSLDIYQQYQTLQNMYDDKLHYIEKLKATRTKLQTDLKSTQQQLASFQKLLNDYHFDDIESLSAFLKKSQKEK